MSMIWTMLAAAAQATAPVPGAEAEALGLRLAQTGTLATIAPLLAAKDTEELVAGHPELTESEKAALRATARRVQDESLARLNAAFGHAYAARLSVEELRTLVAQAESPAATHLHRIIPGALAEALSAVGTMDFKKDIAAAFCRDTGKLCAAQK